MISPRHLLLGSLLSVVSLSLSAQDNPPNFIRATAAFLTVDEYAPNNNNVEVSATDDTATTLSLATFREQMAAAREAGLGGVIDLENPIFGDTLIDIDFSRVRGWATDYVRDVDASITPLQARELALDPARGVVDYETRVPIGNRPDRESLTLGNPTQFNTSNFFRDFVAVYGQQDENRLFITKGPQMKVEGALGSRDNPGLTDPATTNNTFYYGVGVPDSRAAPVSGQRVIGGFPTVHHFQFDPRDVVVAFGITVLSFDNFQQWQGNGGEPDNAGNILVDVTFRDAAGVTTTQRLTGTSAQSSGGNDVFFGLQAPAGSVITDVVQRVVGRNFRSLNYIDDIAFITAPAPSYLTSAVEVSGTVGEPLFYRVEAQKSPSAIVVENLPEGLSFNSANGLVSGTPTATGTVVTTFAVTNAAGTVSLPVTFTIAEPSEPPAIVPAFNLPPSATAILRRAFSLTLATNLDGDASARQNLNFFAIANKVLDSGARQPVSLERAGLSIADGVLSGTPARGDAVGLYEIDLYVANADGGAQHRLIFNVFPPVVPPNFDGDTATDIAIYDATAGTLQAILMGNYETPGDPDDLLTPPAGGTPRLTLATGLGTGWQVFYGDFNGDNRTDVLLVNRQLGRADIVLMDGTGVDRRQIFNFGPNSPWEIVGVANFSPLPGTPTDCIVLRRVSNGDTIGWLMNGHDIRWAGFFSYGTERRLEALASFSGGASSEFFWSNADGSWTISALTALLPTPSDPANLLSITKGTSVTFRLPAPARVEHFGDVDGDGRVDILWRNLTTNELSVWLMQGAGIPPAHAPAAGSNVASLGTPLVGSADFVVAALLDLNGDLKADLLLQDLVTGSYRSVLMDGRNRRALGGFPDLMADGVTVRPQVQRDAGTVEAPGTGQITRALAAKPIQLLGLDAGEALNGVLPADEALTDYQVYEQLKNAAGQPVWVVAGFFANPVADTTKPIAGRNIWANGMIGPGEALADYSIYVRAGAPNQSNPDGSPRPLFNPRTGFVRKQVSQALVAGGTADARWTPDPNGVPYDERGSRGFRRQRDLIGRPLVDAEGQPLYVRWTTPGGYAIPVVEGNLPYEFAIDENFAALTTVVLAGGSGLRPLHQGDFNNDGQLDLVFGDPASSAFTLVLMNGTTVLQTLQISDLPAGFRVQSPASFRYQAPTTVPTGFTAWQIANFVSILDPEAQAEADPDGDGFANLLEYALGVDNVWTQSPRAPQLVPSGEGLRLRLDKARIDPMLVWELEHTADFGQWQRILLPETRTKQADGHDRLEVVIPLDTPAAGYRLRVRQVEN